eukprot:Nk52_evm17s1401 gene=Nk52_evmTU17s1401
MQVRREPAIPLIVHQSYYQSELPNEICKYSSNTWRSLGSNWKYKLWTFEENKEMVENLHPEYFPVFLNAYGPKMRAQFSSMLYMYHHGGVYADLRLMLLRPLEEYSIIYEKKIAVLASQGYYLEWDRSITGDFFISSKGHPFWEFCINIAKERGRSLYEQQKLSYQTEDIRKKNDALSSYYTGARLLYHCVSKYGNPAFRNTNDYDLSSLSRGNQEEQNLQRLVHLGTFNRKSHAEMRIQLKRRGDLVTYGFQGEPQIFVSSPWEFTPLVNENVIIKPNHTLASGQKYCKRWMKKSLVSSKVSETHSTFEQRLDDAPVTLEMAYAKCENYLRRNGAFTCMLSRV